MMSARYDEMVERASERDMTCCWVTGCSSTGIGAQSAVVTDTLRRAGLDITTVASTPLETGHTQPYIRDEGGMVYPITSLAATLRHLDPELVVFHDASAPAREAASEIQPHAVTAARLGVNLREQMFAGEGFSSQIPDLVDFLQSVDHLIASSPRAARTMQTHGIAADRMTHIPTAIDTRSARDPETATASADTVGTISRLGPIKNQLAVIEAVAGLRACTPAVAPELLMAGSINSQSLSPEVLRPLLSHVAPNGRIGIMGHVDEPMADFYPQIDIHAHPSWTENCPQTLLEAAIAGVPSIVSDMAWADAYPEMDLPKCPPDDPMAWRDELHRLLTDDEYRLSLAKQQQAAVIEHYDSDDIAHDYLDLFESLLDDYAAFKFSTGVCVSA